MAVGPDKPVKQVKAVLGAQIGEPTIHVNRPSLRWLSGAPLNQVGVRKRWRGVASNKDSHEAEIDSLAAGPRDVWRGICGQCDTSDPSPSRAELPRSDGSDGLR